MKLWESSDSKSNSKKNIFACLFSIDSVQQTKYKEKETFYMVLQQCPLGHFQRFTFFVCLLSLPKLKFLIPLRAMQVFH